MLTANTFTSDMSKTSAASAAANKLALSSLNRGSKSCQLLLHNIMHSGVTMVQRLGYGIIFHWICTDLRITPSPPPLWQCHCTRTRQLWDMFTSKLFCICTARRQHFSKRQKHISLAWINKLLLVLLYHKLEIYGIKSYQWYCSTIVKRPSDFRLLIF